MRLSINKEAKVLKAPTGNLKTSYLSINELKNKQVVNTSEVQTSSEQKPKKTFSYDDLKMAWRKFAYKAKDDNKDSLFTAMTARDPLLEADYVIQHCVDNNILKDFILQEETNILTFLRQELQNYSISLQLEVGSEESGNKKLYSGQDKFKDMAERNPHLKTMQQRFKLDIEF